MKSAPVAQIKFVSTMMELYKTAKAAHYWGTMLHNYAHPRGKHKKHHKHKLSDKYSDEYLFTHHRPGKDMPLSFGLADKELKLNTKGAYRPNTYGDRVWTNPKFPHPPAWPPNVGSNVNKRSAQDQGGSGPPKVPKVVVHNTQGPAMNTPQRARANQQPLKVIQTVAAPTSRKATSTRKGNSGIIFDLARIMYPVLDTTASRGNLLMGIKCLTNTNKQNGSSTASSFVSMGPTWSAESVEGVPSIAVFSYLWGVGKGAGPTGAVVDVSGQANEFVVNFGNYSMLPKNFMPVPSTVGGQPNSGNDITQAPYLEIYGRSWYGDMYAPTVQGYVMYPDFKFCAQGCQMREYNQASPFNQVPNALQSYAGLQGVLELDGWLQGNSICALAQQAYDNSTLGRRLEGPSSFLVDSDLDGPGVGGQVRVFDSDAICDSAQWIYQQAGASQEIYGSNNFWNICRSVGGLDLPFMYDIADTLHLSNAMDVPIVVNVEIFECCNNVEFITPTDQSTFLDYNSNVDILPLWQASLNEKADDSAKLNGFYSGMVSDMADTVRAERIYDVGKTADNNKKVKKMWKCVGKKHWKLESLQEVSHTFHKYDVINMKNVVDVPFQDMELGTIGDALPTIATLPYKQTIVNPSGAAQVPLDNTKAGDVITETLIENNAGVQRQDTNLMLHTDQRIKKYVKGHSYKYVITWFGLKQMANDSKGLGPSDPPYGNGQNPSAPIPAYPDSGFIRNGRAQLVVSRSCKSTMRVGPQVHKKLFQKQRFGPVGEATGAYRSNIGLDLDLVGNGITRGETSIGPVTGNN